METCRLRLVTHLLKMVGVEIPKSNFKGLNECSMISKLNEKLKDSNSEAFKVEINSCSKLEMHSKLKEDFEEEKYISELT